MSPQDEVEVRVRYTGEWARGFELHHADLAADEPRFQVRRRSDGSVLPAWFSAEEVRPAGSPWAAVART